MRGEGKRKVRMGRVIGDKMDKTVVVSVQRQYLHPIYKRVVRESKKYKAHDEENRCRTGDRVRIAETRPLSKDKRWRVTEILGKGARASREEEKRGAAEGEGR